MDEEGFRYVTALRRNEFDSYCTDIPHDALNAVVIHAADAVAQASKAMAPHLTRISDDLYVRDLGLVERKRLEPPPQGNEYKTVETMRQVRQMHADLSSGRVHNIREAARPFGIAKEHASKLLQLRKLTPDIQDDILAGGATGLSVLKLRAIANLPDPSLQRKTYDEAVVQARVKPDGRASRTRGAIPPIAPPAAPLQVRVVLAFNPEVFVEQRLQADKKIGLVQAQVRKLMREATDSTILEHRVEALLEKHHLKKVLILEIPSGDTSQALLRPDLAEWRSRRRFDGFSMIMAHHGIKIGAGDLVRLYRAKDQVEKDFQTIKSAIHLRPIRHRMDEKVRAHITLCVLALLLERTIEKRLRDAGQPCSAPMVFETLRTAHLNLLDLADGPGAYDLTQANPDQTAIITALGLTSLLDTESVAASLTPR
jgi:hypothetical protein